MRYSSLDLNTPPSTPRPAIIPNSPISSSAGAPGPFLPLEQPLTCACETSGLELQLAQPDFFLLYCSRCNTIVAGQPVSGPAGSQGAQLLALNPEELAQVQAGLQIRADGPLRDALSLALVCTLPVAVRVAQQRLGQRGGLLGELAEALRGSAKVARLLALQFVARLPQVPLELQPIIVSAVQHELSLEPPLPEALVALMALYPVAAQALQLRHRVTQLQQQLASGEQAELAERVAGAVLAAMGRAEVANKERFALASERLATLLRQGQLAEARALLAQTYPADDPNDPDGGRTGRSALCEAAAEHLLGGPGARLAATTLLSWALAYAEEYASWASSGGEGMARMVEVERLRQRIAKRSESEI